MAPRPLNSQNTGKTVGSRSGLRPWKKGQSGNPGGRPKLPPEFKAAIDALVIPSVETLQRAIYGKDLDLAVRAANIVLNRKYGIPKQTIESTGATTMVVPEAIAKRMGISTDPADYAKDASPEGHDPAKE